MTLYSFDMIHRSQSEGVVYPLRANQSVSLSDCFPAVDFAEFYRWLNNTEQ